MLDTRFKTHVDIMDRMKENGIKFFVLLLGG